MNSCSQEECLKVFGDKCYCDESTFFFFWPGNDQFGTKMNRIFFPSGNTIQTEERHLRKRQTQRQ